MSDENTKKKNKLKSIQNAFKMLSPFMHRKKGSDCESSTSEKRRSKSKSAENMMKESEIQISKCIVTSTKVVKEKVAPAPPPEKPKAPSVKIKETKAPKPTTVKNTEKGAEITLSMKKRQIREGERKLKELQRQSGQDEHKLNEAKALIEAVAAISAQFTDARNNIKSSLRRNDTDYVHLQELQYSQPNDLHSMMQARKEEQARMENEINALLKDHERIEELAKQKSIITRVSHFFAQHVYRQKLQ
ncbi:unnamed protein product [Caenorhabditis auriculariae]|uniref:Uncharacterized protein n=1 Tax=Caenorhabditis auriculariae TaxID=2777116 RepID=A0A8S1HNR5_9PELO|nr:unnamed protein product [Caenorhabditis auriculariae]